MERHIAYSLLPVLAVGREPRRQRTVSQWLAALVERVREAGRRRRDFERLMAMSDRSLADIGLTRVDVIAAYSYGSWPCCRGKGGRADA